MKDTCTKAIRKESGEIICRNTGEPCGRAFFDGVGNRWKVRGAGSCLELNTVPAAPKKKTTRGRKKKNG